MSIRDLIVFDDDRVVKNDQVSKSRYANRAETGKEPWRKGVLGSEPSEAQREVLRKLAERAVPVELEDSE